MEARSRLARNISARITVLALLMCAAVSAAQSESDGIRLDLPAVAGFAQYTDLLANPAYLALALDNNGIVPSFSSRIVVPDSRTVKLRNGVLRFAGHQGTIYSYEAGYTIDLGVSATTVSFPVTVDIANLPQGRVTVTAKPPLAKFFPKDLVERIRYKATIMSDRAAQNTVLEYLNRLSANTKGGSLFEAILLDAYNKSESKPTTAQAGRDVGDAEPLSDQLLLIATLVIWLVAVPTAFWIQRRRHRRLRPAQTS